MPPPPPEPRDSPWRTTTPPEDRIRSVPIPSAPADPGFVHLGLIELRKRLRDMGPTYLRTHTLPDIFVKGVALRRNSALASSDPSLAWEAKREASAPMGDLRRGFDDEIFVQVRVRPRDGRRPFMVQRRFSLADLRATIPVYGTMGCSEIRLSSRPSSAVNLTASPLLSSSVGVATAAPRVGQRRQLSIAGAMCGPLAPSRHRTASTGVEVKLPPRNYNNVMPIHLEYARSFLPVLAALLLSGYVREGDVVDVPVPHPAAWRQTVTHVYTGMAS
ncbi:unnamed protein product [Parascedosporium putredinis]|uniref:Uncharacterized protein n=1 Tax=Parascedosporium putredinis TaxID=1442378 RepID=A0A9P1MCM7_9PEZI|nr:unnamed protein product [Parascedosporium putredinis]CAI8001935.1 unnamed protein product [Parascedosporium putredinis]